jgi:hypothetical protein
VVNCKNGDSSYEISRDLGVTQEAAWFMLHRIRLALPHGSWEKLGGSDGGPVEVDEIFLDPSPRKMHSARRSKMQLASHSGYAKAIVMGMLDREFRKVRGQVIPDVKRGTLQNEILNQIEKKSTVYAGAGLDTIA